MANVPSATLRYVAAWVVAAAVAATALVVFFSGAPRVTFEDVVLLIALTAAAEAVLLYLHHGKSREFVSLVETAIAINILLLPALPALGVTLAGVLIASLIHRRHPVKALFNLAQYGVGTAIAIAIFRTIAGTGDVSPGITSVAGLFLGMAAFGLVNAAAMSGIVGVLEGRAFRKTFSEGIRITALTVLGNTSVGVLAAVVWEARPELTPLFLAPALTMHLAYRGVVRANEILEKIRESERLKDDFLARVSHELRTPLTPIKGYAQTMLRRQGSMTPEKQQEVLTMIVERVGHMETLINDLLVVSQAVIGDGEKLTSDLRSVPVELGRVCEAVADHVQKKETDRVVDVASSPEVKAMGDPVKIGQVVGTLVSNACKFSESDRGVEIDVTHDETHAIVSVTDHGRGIPPDHMERIFDRFHRVEDPLRMETGGMGLGLFISRSLARAMGGDIEVTSQLGLGSTFSLRLPLLLEDREVA